MKISAQGGKFRYGNFKKRLNLKIPPVHFFFFPSQPAGKATVSRYLHSFKVWLKLAKAHTITISERNRALIRQLKTLVVQVWSFVFDYNVSPLRHIPDVGIRHYVMQVLGLMWAVSFSVAIGSYTFLAYSILGHAVLIAAAAVTVATFTVAAKRPKVFMRGAGRRFDGEHE